MLYIVATPIGNLEDMTFRAVRILQECDKIYCEDTRHSRILLKHYDIKTPTQSFPSHKESTKTTLALKELQEGKQLALISDAGLPALSDPGADLIRLCHQHNLPISVLPGANAALCALVLSGLSNRPFQFLGFFPRKPKEAKALAKQALQYGGITLFYISPHRLTKDLAYFPPQTEILLARELTKQYEELRRATAQEHLAYYASHPIRGEFVALVLGNDTSSYPTIDPTSLYALLREHLSNKEASRIASTITGLPKRHFYNTDLS